MEVAVRIRQRFKLFTAKNLVVLDVRHLFVRVIYVSTDVRFLQVFNKVRIH